MRRGLALLAAVGLCACQPDNSLWGSASELFPLDVSRVDVRRGEEALQVSYFANRGADVDLVARVVVRTDGLTLTPGQEVSLSGEAVPGHQRATVLHAAAGEPVRVLPRVKEGVLVLEEGGEVGERVRGQFDLLFEQGDDYGAGRTLSGRFSMELQDGRFDPPDAGTDAGVAAGP